eukprot:441424_1
MSVLGKRSRDTNHNTTSDNDHKDINDFYVPSNKKMKSTESNGNNQKHVDGLDNNASFPNEKAQEIVILNVGGTKYTTTIQTLTGYNSMLKARFSSKYAMKPSQDGSHFIDRDGKLFKYILEYFRTGQLLLPTSWNKQDIWRFYNEIRYYVIPSLFQPILLKLFDSKMIEHDLLKMKILHKLTDFCDDKSINTTLNNLKDWKLEYEYDKSDGKKLTKYDIEFLKLTEKMQRCLVLFEEEFEHRIFGMLLTHGHVGCNKDDDSFAFETGIYSCRIPSYYTDKDIKVSFEKIRYFEDDEVNELMEDFFGGDRFPFIIRPALSVDSENIASIYHYTDNVDWNGKANIVKIEIWFVPMY